MTLIQTDRAKASFAVKHNGHSDRVDESTVDQDTSSKNALGEKADLRIGR
ncbi:hypothetical protein GGE48_006695 [Rhizobium leguminosarum]|nr:hypothetical protein [Rhizobium leguminosarum]